MEQKINIAKLLKNCPEGMELDCVMYEDVYFDYVDELDIIHCYIHHETHKTSVTFNQYGTYNSDIKSRCVIFPKGKNTWEGFVPPCKFKDGDVVVTTLGSIAIISNKIDNKICITYCGLFGKDAFTVDEVNVCPERHATEEEKAKLFDAIKTNGYKWNPDIKTLEKLVEPKFKAGDKIEKCGYRFTIAKAKDDYYLTKCGNKIPIDNQDDFSLVPNKFDITTLKPFDKVLVRQSANGKWGIDFFGSYTEGFYYTTGSSMYIQCVPYDSNQHLLGTTNNCDEFYKTW